MRVVCIASKDCTTELISHCAGILLWCACRRCSSSAPNVEACNALQLQHSAGCFIMRTTCLWFMKEPNRLQ
jgi:hypothetical protein